MGNFSIPCLTPRRMIEIQNRVELRQRGNRETKICLPTSHMCGYAAPALPGAYHFWMRDDAFRFLDLPYSGGTRYTGVPLF